MLDFQVFVKLKDLLLVVRDKECMCKVHSFSQGPLPPSVYLGDTDVIHMIKQTRPYSFVTAYCKQSKTGAVGRYGNETRD